MVSEFTEALGDIASYAFACEDVIRSGIPSNESDFYEIDRRALQIVRDGNLLTIGGSPTSDSLLVEYDYIITEQIRVSSIDTDSVADVMENLQERGDLKAAQEAINAAGLDSSNLSIAGTWDKINGEKIFNGFRVSRRIWALEDSFGPKDYDEAVSEVRREGVRIAREAHSELELISGEPDDVVEKTDQGSRGFM